MAARIPGARDTTAPANALVTRRALASRIRALVTPADTTATDDIPEASTADGTNYAYQWNLASVEVPNATGPTYMVRTADEGKSLTCTVVATNPEGSAAATSAATTTVGIGELQGVQAVASDSFVDFLSINTHMGYGNTPYDNQPLVEATLADIGFRHIRDSFTVAGYSYCTFLKKLHADHGVKTSWIIDYRIGDQTPAQIAAYLVANPDVVPCIDNMEGPNEWDETSNTETIVIDGTPYHSGLAYMASFQRTIWNTFKANPATASIPISGPSFAHGNETAEFVSVGATSLPGGTTIVDYMDYGTIHDYWGSQFISSSYVTTLLANNAYVSGAKKLITTESGWNNSSNYPPTSANPGVSDAIAAKMIIAGMFVRFRNGSWERAATYELFDEGGTDTNFGNSGWGICTDGDSEGKSYTGTASGGGNLTSFYKPQAHAYKTVIGFLTDPGADFDPGKLDYTLSGTDANTQTILFQKSDGSFWLVIYEVNTPLWSTNTGAAVSPPPPRTHLTLTLNSATASTISQYLPTTGGTTAVSTTSNVSTATVTCGPEVNLVKIVI